MKKLTLLFILSIFALSDIKCLGNGYMYDVNSTAIIGLQLNGELVSCDEYNHDINYKRFEDEI